MPIIIICAFVLLIVLAVYIANRFSDVAAMKGHTERKYFWICLWLGWIGYLLVIALPDRSNTATSIADELPEL